MCGAGGKTANHGGFDPLNIASKKQTIAERKYAFRGNGFDPLNIASKKQTIAREASFYRQMLFRSAKHRV